MANVESWIKLVGTAVVIAGAYLFVAPKLGKYDPVKFIGDHIPQIGGQPSKPVEVPVQNDTGVFPANFNQYSDDSYANAVTFTNDIVPSVYPQGVRLSGAYD
ncbi:MAG: hypothetical protein DA328_07960 [Nitrososphaeraceae archaeon]|nr:hypothetical protein [Nitrososphaeraceae archaeon]